MTVYWLEHCGGYNPRTGKRVGERHRWSQGKGQGTCIWCHRSADQLRYKAPDDVQADRKKWDNERLANKRDRALEG